MRIYPGTVPLKNKYFPLIADPVKSEPGGKSKRKDRKQKAAHSKHEVAQIRVRHAALELAGGASPAFFCTNN